jgi:hypothetical protein
LSELSGQFKKVVAAFEKTKTKQKEMTVVYTAVRHVSSLTLLLPMDGTLLFLWSGVWQLVLL